MKNLEIIIERELLKTIKKTITQAPKEIIDSLKSSLDRENSDVAIAQLEMMLENFAYGAENEIPICQDTGVLNFFIELGANFPIISNFKNIINKCVRNATNSIPLRGNSVDPITNENPENNLGINVPPIYLEIIENDEHLKITVLAKGGGAENISKLFMLNPSEGLQTFQNKIIESIKEAGGMPCPPIILGIGIGGDATICMKLAKKALLRPLNDRHKREDVAKMELEILEKINSLQIGPMGLGGKTTALDVHIEIAMRHPASFPVGLIVQCYSHRYCYFKINKKGEVIDAV
ncbi:MAG: putative L(+)-tartrate dehydratase subunit alpha [Promethearchaeota archaeon]|nr:MAG: putative L(+)-tartrate dehydratase subunit alpha [Candidatus Lokiarchaeota archaeon]